MTEPANTSAPRQSVEDMERTDGMLQSIQRRINAGPLQARAETSPAMQKAIDTTQAAMEKLGITIDSSLPYRDQILEVRKSMGRVGEDIIDVEEVGHSILDGLAQTLPSETERDTIQQGIDDIDINDERPDEERRVNLMNTILEEGLSLPRNLDAEEINDEHRYFFVNEEEGVLRVNSLLIDKDIESLTKAGEKNLPPFTDPKGEEVLQNFIAKLEALKVVDQINALSFTPPAPPTREETAVMRQGKGAIKLLMIGLLAFGATMSLIIERNRKFPFFTLLYGGLALVLARPDLFQGKEKQVASQLNFVLEDERWKKMIEDPSMKPKLTEDFITDLTDNSDVRSASRNAGAGRLSLKEYIAVLEEEGVAKKHIEFLTELHADHPSYFSFITVALSRVSDEGARVSLIGFAKDGISVASLKDLDTSNTSTEAV